MGTWNWIKQQITFGGVLENIVASLVWAIIGGSLVLLINTYRNDRGKFAGQWKSVIYWQPDWAKHIFSSTENVSAPQSQGFISLSYGSGYKKSQYWGLGFFKLQSGDEEYARIAIEIFDVITTRPFFQSESPYIKALKLERFSIEPLVRRAMRDSFSHAPHKSYYIAIGESSADRIEGVVKKREYDKGEEVGRFVANRIL